VNTNRIIDEELIIDNINITNEINKSDHQIIHKNEFDQMFKSKNKISDNTNLEQRKFEHIMRS